MTYRELIEQGGLAYASSGLDINDFVPGQIIAYEDKAYFLSNDPNWDGERPHPDYMQGYRFSWYYSSDLDDTLPEDIIPKEEPA